MSLQMADRELRLSNNALHLSFNFFDRYLGLMLCGERNLQLVSTACMYKSDFLDLLLSVSLTQKYHYFRWDVVGPRSNRCRHVGQRGDG